MGSAFRIRALTREKMATLAPMPRASDSSATPLTIGVWRIWRKANFRSRPIEDTNPMVPLTGSPPSRLVYLRDSKQGSRFLFTPLESEAGPGGVEGADLEIHPAGAKAALADDVAV